MNNMELTDRIRGFFSDGINDFQLYLIKRIDSDGKKGEYEYKSYYPNLDRAQCDEFIEEIKQRLFTEIDGKTLVNFDVSNSEDDCIEIIEEVSVYNFDKISAQLTQYKADVLSLDNDFDFETIWGYAFVFNGNGKTLAAFRKNTKPNLFKNTRVFAFATGDTIRPLKKNVIAIDFSIDAFSFGGNIYVINRYYFQLFFSFQEAYTRYVEESLELLRQQNVIENFDDFAEACLNSKYAVKKMVNIIKSNKLQWLKEHIDNAQKVSEEYGLKVEFSDNKLVYNNGCDIRDIIQLLNELCVIGAVDGKKLFATAVKTVEQREAEK